MAFLIVFLLIQSIYCLTTVSVSAETEYFALNIILTLYCFLGLGFVGTLLGFHTFLIYRNTTTN
jgi:hypothetical protein